MEDATTAANGVAQILSNYEWWQALIVIGVAFIAVMTVIVVVFKLFSKNENGSISFLGLTLSKGAKEAQEASPVTVNVNMPDKEEDEPTDVEEILDDKLSLQACMDQVPSYRGELLLVVSKSIRFGYEQGHLKETKLIRAQMNSAQVKTDTIKNIFLKEYTNKTIYYKQLGKQTNNSYDIFNEFISRIIQNKLLDELRRAFKENHLAQYSDENFEEYYCRDHIKRMLENLGLEIMNIMPECIMPTVEDVASVLSKNETVFYGYLKEALYDARTLIINNDNELISITKNFNEEILKLTGIPEASKRAE